MGTGIKETWNPLMGYGPYDNIIERARALWSVPGRELRSPEGSVIYSLSFTNELIEKAGSIYNKWNELLEQNPLQIKQLESNMQIILRVDNSKEVIEDFIQDICLWFRELNVSVFEIFSILAIYEARVSKNDSWPLELLSIAEKYIPNPDAERGKKVINGSKRSGAARTAQIKEERDEFWCDWQNRADGIWARNPDFSNTDVATLIRKELIKENAGNIPDKCAINTIRQRIKKP